MNLDSLFQGDSALISEKTLNLLMDKTLQLLPRFVQIFMEDGCLRPLSVAISFILSTSLYNGRKGEIFDDM